MGIEIRLAGGYLSDIFPAGTFLAVEGVSGRATLSPDVQVWNAAGVDGGGLLGVSVPPRTIQVALTLQGADQREIEQTLSGFLHHDTPQILGFSDQPSRFYRAVMSGFTASTERPDWVRVQISFLCTDPFLYSTTKQVTLEESNLIDVDTNYFALPKIYLELSAARSGITHIEVNGRRWWYYGDLPMGAEIEIDSSKAETRVDGELRVLEVFGVYPTLDRPSPSYPKTLLTTNAPINNFSLEYEPRWV